MMKTLKVLTLIGALMVLTVVGCNQPYFHIPMKNGKPDITHLSTTTVTPEPVTTSDSKFTVTAHLPNAREGDTMTATVLKLQLPQNGSNKALLPVSGTKKTLTVGSNLNVSVTYTRQEAKLINPGDAITVTFGGKHDSAQMDITLEKP